MVDQLSPELKSELKEAFSLFDKDNDGIIDTNQLKPLMRSLGQNPSEAEIKDMINKLDDCNGTIDFSDFLTIIASKLKENDPEKDFIEALRVYDNEGKGFLKAEELRTIMSNVEEKTREEIDEIIKKVDSKGDGNICYKDFVKVYLGK